MPHLGFFRFKPRPLTFCCPKSSVVVLLLNGTLDITGFWGTWSHPWHQLREISAPLAWAEVQQVQQGWCSPHLPSDVHRVGLALWDGLLPFAAHKNRQEGFEGRFSLKRGGRSCHLLWMLKARRVGPFPRSLSQCGLGSYGGHGGWAVFVFSESWNILDLKESQGSLGPAPGVAKD